MPNIKELISDLEQNIYCRIKPSSVAGVGVFAIRDIPKGTNPFKMFKEGDFVEADAKEIFDNLNIPQTVKELINDMYVVEEEKIYLNSFGLNSINISSLLNHSNNPNMETTDGAENFIALRDIKTGEELFVNYYTYSENNETIK
jgi:SET domain-containing protein